MDANMVELPDNALMVIPSAPDEALTLFTGEYDVTVAPLLRNVKLAVDAYLVAPPDPKTEIGRKAIASFDHKLARSKTAFDNAGFNVNKTLKELPKKIDENRRIVKRLFEDWQAKVTAPKKAWEDAETARKERHTVCIANINQIGEMTEVSTAADLRDAIGKVESCLDGFDGEEFQSEYEIARTNALGRLTAALQAREKYDADQIELASLRQAQAQRDAKDAEERAAREAKERFARDRQTVIDLIRLDANVEFLASAGIRQRIAKLQNNDLLPANWGDFLGEARRAVAETLLSLRASLEEAERKELEQETARAEAAKRFQAAEEETRRVEIERKREAAERQRLEEEARKREEEARIAAAKAKAAADAETARAADLDHRKRCNNAACDALALLMPGGGAKGNVELAKTVLTEIVRGKIPHLRLEY